MTRGKFNLKQPCVCTNLKSMCISICGVILWNGLDEEIKHSKKISHSFTKMNKITIFGRYRNEEGECNTR